MKKTGKIVLVLLLLLCVTAIAAFGVIRNHIKESEMEEAQRAAEEKEAAEAAGA